MSKTEQAISVITFSAILSLPGLLVYYAAAAGNDIFILDPDVWWHLKTGDWILAHGALPTTDPFSHTAAGTEWVAYSWLYEVLLSGVFSVLGLRGIVLLTAVLWTATVAAFFVGLRMCRIRVLVAGLLTLVAIVGTLPFTTPRPWHATMACTVVVLSHFLRGRVNHRQRRLLWLVPLFCFWANVHIQFVLGLLILAIAVAVTWCQRLRAPCFPVESQGICPKWMTLIFFLCVAATMVNPYGWRLYDVVFLYASQAGLADSIQEFQAMSFRLPSEWLVLAITVLAAFSIGRQRRVQPLFLLVYLAATYFGFRCARDSWFLLFVGLFAIVDVHPVREPESDCLPKLALLAVGGILGFLLISPVVLLSEEDLRERLKAQRPLAAAEVIRSRGYDGPMYNTFDWGGILIYWLPEYPVSIDGRTNVHGVERCLRNVETCKGKSVWKDDPELAEAGVVVLPRDIPLANLLRYEKDFELAYEDAVTAVFVPQTATGTVPTREPEISEAP